MYRLRLNQENTWRISADDDRRALLDEMARVMELEPADASEYAANLIFTGPDAVSSLLKSSHGNAELLYEDVRQKLWWLAEQSRAVCEVSPGIEGDDVYQVLRMAVQLIHHHNCLRGGLTLHGALVEFDGRGVLLAAKGGTGKSTCCRRLPDNWKAWCDDETLITRRPAGEYVAHPFPTWSHYLDENGDRTWTTDTDIQLHAICFLQQSGSDGSRPLPAFEAAMWIYHSVFPIYTRRLGRQLDEREKRLFNTRLFDNACDLARVVPSHVLQVNLNGRFWDKIVEVLDDADLTAQLEGSRILSGRMSNEMDQTTAI
jgi:SynChlorMet cassette protein ScmC